MAPGEKLPSVSAPVMPDSHARQEMEPEMKQHVFAQAGETEMPLENVQPESSAKHPLVNAPEVLETSTSQVQDLTLDDMVAKSEQLAMKEAVLSAQLSVMDLGVEAKLPNPDLKSDSPHEFAADLEDALDVEIENRGGLLLSLPSKASVGQVAVPPTVVPPEIPAAPAPAAKAKAKARTTAADKAKAAAKALAASGSGMGRGKKKEVRVRVMSGDCAAADAGDDNDHVDDDDSDDDDHDDDDDDDDDDDGDMIEWWWWRRLGGVSVFSVFRVCLSVCLSECSVSVYLSEIVFVLNDSDSRPLL